MCNYKRFEKIANSIETSNVFNTKLGERCVSCFKFGVNDSIEFIYYDYDDSILFNLTILKTGKIIKNFARKGINDISIFSAIYEIECLLNNEQDEAKDDILTMLFDTIPYEFGFTVYR